MGWTCCVIWFLCLSARECLESKIQGEVKSPQYPRPYPPSTLSQWTYGAPEGYKMQLYLTHLDIKDSVGCHEDFLMVLDDQNVLGKFCGQENSSNYPGKEPILSHGSSLTLLFRASASDPEQQQHTGFFGRYVAIVALRQPPTTVGLHKTPIPEPFLGTRLALGGPRSLQGTSRSRRKRPRPRQTPPRRPPERFRPHPARPPLRPPERLHPHFFKFYNCRCVINVWLSCPFPGNVAKDATDCGEPEPLLNGGMIVLSRQDQYASVMYYCNEPYYSLPGGVNVTFTCEGDGKWRSKHSDVTPTCMPVCGQPTTLISNFQRILGGREAPDNTIPWQVLVSLKVWGGGGMVIGDRWIMTAAQVVNNANPISKEQIKIYMGRTDVNTLTDSHVFVASIHIHPEYNVIRSDNDIALIKLRDPITFNSSIMPICLPAEGATYVTGMMGLVSGFGDRVLRLNYVEVPVVDQETCKNSLFPRADASYLTNNMICAGLPEGGKDACRGDSGGPFALNDNGSFWAAGISSWGEGCGRPGKYGVYTRVANYIDWINKTMQEN
ncbi:complement C1r-B subcomponent-like [Cottoperca gobio]|uniref:Complement C1r-B subcomponent-like n=1 Tax=Cottoperca gobio TaxID=56716 RepID=A0A6J2PBK6_COTGO|nr:complement C1r-B subcomponent-like [Cottoperca gobio]